MGVAGGTTSLCLACSHTLAPRHTAGQAEVALEAVGSLLEAARARLRREERLRSDPGHGDPEGQGHIGRRQGARLESGAASHALTEVADTGVAAVGGRLPLRRAVVGRRIPREEDHPYSHSALTW